MIPLDMIPSIIDMPIRDQTYGIMDTPHTWSGLVDGPGSLVERIRILQIKKKVKDDP